jgi:hypothetical protein
LAFFRVSEFSEFARDFDPFDLFHFFNVVVQFVHFILRGYQLFFVRPADRLLLSMLSGKLLHVRFQLELNDVLGVSEEPVFKVKNCLPDKLVSKNPIGLVPDLNRQHPFIRQLDVQLIASVKARVEVAFNVLLILDFLHTFLRI